MNRSEQVNELAAALAKAQTEMTAARMDKENPHFKSRYASLAAIWDAIRPPLGKHGLSVAQRFQPTADGGMEIETVLLHSSGQWMASTLPVLSQDKRPQSIGSAITYMRRYALSAIAGIAADEDDNHAADEDDDANAANGPVAPEERRQAAGEKVFPIKAKQKTPVKIPQATSARSAPATTECACGGMMMISKFGEEPRPWYCPACKATKPRQS